MNRKFLILLLVNITLLNVGTYFLTHKPQPPVVIAPKPEPATPLPEPAPQPKAQNPTITKKMPGYLNYQNTVAQLKQWNQEAPELTEVGTYGKSARGQDIYYLRIYNKNIINITERPKVMITACIHGNEPWASSTVMAWVGTLLDEYGDKAEITSLLDSRDIYIVPVVSPDSYPNSRHVDGVDPNRDFPTEDNPNKKSTPSVQALRDFFLKVRPNAIISGHTWGRVCLIPWGDSMQNCPDHEEYMRVVGKMAQMSNYRCIRACDMYQGGGRLNNPPIVRACECWSLTPIYGAELDWYYRNGAMAAVMEFGTHQSIPTMQDTSSEFQRTYPGIQHFIKEAPVVKLKLTTGLKRAA